jgi:anti-sigma regulatory factor (Ser/Thr protein kinase)
MSHDLFVYDEDAAFVDEMPPFLAAGVDAGEVVVAVLAARNNELTRDALGATARDVTFIAAEDHYTRPEAAIADYDASIRRHLRDGAPAVRLCGELPMCTTQPQWDDWVAYEAILNRAFAHQPVQIMCVYDERRLPASVVDGARRCHPDLAHGHSREPNPRYQDPADVVREMRPVAPDPAGELDELTANGNTVAFRERLAGSMGRAGVADEQARGMLVAADEILSNAVRHGDGVVGVRAGRVADDFLCEITAAGQWRDDPLAGLLPPKPGDSSGGGLWVARQLTRRLELLPSADGGLIARLWA